MYCCEGIVVAESSSVAHELYKLHGCVLSTAEAACEAVSLSGHPVLSCSRCEDSKYDSTMLLDSCVGRNSSDRKGNVGLQSGLRVL